MHRPRTGNAALIALALAALVVVLLAAVAYLFASARAHEAMLREEAARAAAEDARARAELASAMPAIDRIRDEQTSEIERLRAELERERDARQRLEDELAALREGRPGDDDAAGDAGAAAGDEDEGAAAGDGAADAERFDRAMSALEQSLMGDEFLQQFGSKSFREEIARLQETLGDAGLERLTDALRSGTAQERLRAALLLEGWNDPAALPALEEAVSQGQDVMLQRFAAHAIALIAGDEQLPALERIAFDEGMEPGARVNAAYGLASRGNTRGAELLIAMDRGAELPADLRGAVFPALVSVATEAPREVMLPFLHESIAEGSSMDRAFMAMSALQRIGDRSSLPALEQVLQGEQPGSVKNLAKKIINEIEGFQKYDEE